MKCPRCGVTMRGHDFGGVLVDRCDWGCGGLWLDWGELSGLDDPGEGFGEPFMSAIAMSRSVRRDGPIRCTRCDIPMREHRNGSGSHVFIDECYECRGFFLDPGELRAIRDEVLAAASQAEKIESLLLDEPLWRAHLLELERDREFTRAAERLRSVLMYRVPWWAKLWVAWPF